MEADKIVANIRRRSAELICEEILINGCAKAADNNACKEKVKKELGVDLEENEAGYLIFANGK